MLIMPMYLYQQAAILQNRPSAGAVSFILLLDAYVSFRGTTRIPTA